MILRLQPSKTCWNKTRLHHGKVHSKLGPMKTRPALRVVTRVVTMTMAMPLQVEMSNRVREAR